MGIKTGSEKKYRIIEEIHRKGYRVSFDVLYTAKSITNSQLQKELGEKEAEYIRRYRPMLNTQIPKEDDWTRFDYHEVVPEEIRKHFNV